jgi:hypothetical protein
MYAITCCCGSLGTLFTHLDEGLLDHLGNFQRLGSRDAREVGSIAEHVLQTHLHNRLGISNWVRGVIIFWYLAQVLIQVQGGLNLEFGQVDLDLRVYSALQQIRQLLGGELLLQSRQAGSLVGQDDHQAQLTTLFNFKFIMGI